MYTCFYFDIGYVVLQNCDAITQGIVAFPYALLLEAFVPYLSDSQPKVHIAYHSIKLFILHSVAM